MSILFYAKIMYIFDVGKSKLRGPSMARDIFEFLYIGTK